MTGHGPHGDQPCRRSRSRRASLEDGELAWSAASSIGCHGADRRVEQRQRRQEIGVLDEELLLLFDALVRVALGNLGRFYGSRMMGAARAWGRAAAPCAIVGLAISTERDRLRAESVRARRIRRAMAGSRPRDDERRPGPCAEPASRGARPAGATRRHVIADAPVGGTSAKANHHGGSGRRPGRQEPRSTVR